MNKKFSTLLCASLLFSSAFSAVNAIDLTDAAVGVGATAVAKLDKAALSGVYQLRVGTQVLVIEDGKYVLKNVNDGFDLQASLWCVQVTEEGQGKEPIYDFVNKATGEFLAISEEDVVGLQVGEKTKTNLSVGETFGGWAFSPEYKENLKGNMPLFTYQEADNVLLLVKGDNGGLKAKKVKASVARSESERVQFTLFDAGTYVLSAAEINAYLKDNKNVLTFTPDANADVNPFSTTAFVAKGVAVDTDHNFVYVTSKSDVNAYLKVDTAANGVGIQFLKFGWTDMAKEKDFDNSLLVDQHKFLFTYRPSLDQLRIQVKQARYKSDKNAEKYWSEIDGTAKGKIYNYGDNFVDPFKTEGNVDAAKLHVKLQNFTVADRIATIGEQPINTKIGFGLKGCFVTSDKTSVDNGLYIIKNAKGQVLAAPIHKNAEGGNKQYAIEWVTLDEQEPLHMPAYQWVITKTLNAEVSQPVSPVKIVNREFPNAKDWDNVQFRLNEDGEIYTLTTGADMLNNVTFVQIKDSAIIKDKKLGYKHIDSNDLLVNRYKFNYLNPFSMEYWIANGTGKDSLIYVKQDAGDYALVEGSTYEYGIDVDAALLKKIPGLAQLERTNYVIAKDEQDRLVEAYGSKYSMGVANYGSNNMVVDTFFFKENNHYDGKDFYAIVESNYNRTAHATEIQNTGVTKKVGIADDGMSAGLKVQLLNETRTSAFTVEPSTTPLYRRFNNVALSESATDGRDSLRFFETIRKEYLMDENNSNLTDANVDYLGMWTADKATGLSFQIDTAWVNRGAGYIKPQYLISVAHNDFAGTPGKPCTEDGPHVDKDGNITDAEHCVHATPAIPGFERAKYLVSFQDSVDVYGQDKPYADIKGGYTRVGFVEGIRVADTLWILPAEFVALANDKISFDALEAYNDSVKNLASKSYLIKNRLDGDDHKNYTWSFRYVHPENAGNVTEEGVENQFLFESNNYDNKIIAPENAAWLKIQNGCVVLTDKSSTFSHAATGGDGALIFNVENKVDDQLATDNEEIATSEVTVIALQGAVRVANAEGKKVVITNILGQTVANTVITSSDATIAAPQGVVVVAVEGEEAVKAIVK
ncbi:DUF6383 domain-containing protein [Parabacteroides merdae]|uniref:DUF6383 domain-containing protein n=1 Tax=Parabacteroides merdae TaxID=46503 RepID=UPI001C24B3FE|nr:DUF6383 domain-containing protein [Parabacteroides merdae]MBU9060935.1 hypothetical protein [Parabacteroides merdae]MCG4834245.1 DUF6383 domain-containing protein [Parabacteroides merdae]MCQ5192574.1 DUF6383 domain-containing protein [Parabacteroides merdae]